MKGCWRQEDGGGVEGPYAYLGPQIQLDNCRIILNPPETGPKTDKTNSTFKEREETTLKEVGSVEAWLREETNPDCCRGEVPIVTEKGKREEHTGECTRRTPTRSHCLKNERG